jgi:hypothetical protein
MAKIKQHIMLSGGVIASMAMSDGGFQKFQDYGKSGKAVLSLTEDLTVVLSVTMHAIFCYGWWDSPQNVDEGWWLCKNR